MNRTRYECQSQGCANEVLSKTVDGHPIDPPDRRHRGGGPSSPSGSHHRHGHPPGPQQAAAQASPYCKRHACIHFLSLESCLSKKPPHDSVCAVHARCPVTDCSQARAQYLDPNFDRLSSATPTYARFDVCADHKCTVQRCPQRRASSGTSFCQTHRCRVDGCINQHLDHLDCCQDHQCRARGCRNPTNGEYPYCGHHIRCDMSNCGGQKHQDRKTKEYLPFCTQHVTCSAPRCEKIKIERSAFCEDHTCRERECGKSTNSKPYCDDHRCADINCISPRPWSKNPKRRPRFCPLHTCRAEDCKEPVDSLALFCQTHGCSRPRCHEEILAEGMCLEHMKAHYTTIGRHRAQAHPLSRTRHITPPSSRVEDDNNNNLDSVSENEDEEEEQGHEVSPFALLAAPGRKTAAPATKAGKLTNNASHRNPNRRDDPASDDDISDLSDSSNSSSSDNGNHNSGKPRRSGSSAKQGGKKSKISHSQSLPGPIRVAPPLIFPAASGPGNPPPSFGPPVGVNSGGGGGGGNAGFVVLNPGGMSGAGGPGPGAGNGGHHHQISGGPPPVRRMTGGGGHRQGGEDGW